MSQKIAEYFELKGTIKTLREDVKELVDEHELTEQVDELKKQLKELRDDIKEDENIVIITEKIKGLKERQDLIKEIIMAEMKESGEEKIVYEGNEIVIAESLKFKRMKSM